jgi:hypothetical protein
MCKNTERPQRRHRPVYIAPSAGPMHPQRALPDFGDQSIPLFLEIPSTFVNISPPSTGPLSGNLELPPTPPPRWNRRIWNAFLALYHWSVDVLLLVVVCFMGCFFYDVEVKVVKSDRQQAMARGRSGRVVIRTDEQQQHYNGPRTPLLRTPPRSGTLWSGLSNNSPRSGSRDRSWDVV